MYKNILIPIDIGNMTQARENLETAKNMLAKEGQINLLNVIEQLPEYVASQLPPELLTGRSEAASWELTKLIDEAGISAKPNVVYGHAAMSILDFAENLKPDIIIVASHQPEMLDYFLGSTAARVVRKAKCAVLVTR